VGSWNRSQSGTKGRLIQENTDGMVQEVEQFAAGVETQWKIEALNSPPSLYVVLRVKWAIKKALEANFWVKTILSEWH
jgi:hypothetical protein